MKKKIVVLALIAGAFTQQASAQKGGILLYGDFGFSMQKEKDDSGFNSTETTTTTGMFAPGIGYGLSEKLIAGINLGIYSETYKPDGGGKIKTSAFAAGPFIRYTKKMGEIFSMYGQANLSYLGGKRETNNGYGQVITYTQSGVGFNIIPNIGIDVGKGWGLDFAFGALEFSSIAEKNKDDNDAKTTDTDFGLNLSGSSLRVGVSYMFNCSKKE